MMLLKLFLTFFKIGLFTVGGGYAMLPMIQSEVINAGWLPSEELVNFIAVSESTPGPFAVNIATYIGTEMAGITGSVCATLGVIMPSFIIIIMVAKFFEKFKENNIVQGCMSGLKPAVIGLIASAVISIGKTVLFPLGVSLSVFSDKMFYVSLAIFLVMAFLVIKKKTHPILIICISATVGILAGYLL